MNKSKSGENENVVLPENGNQNGEANIENTSSENESPKKRTRKKHRKNRVAPTQISNGRRHRGGRPAGSKNKPTVAAVDGRRKKRKPGRPAGSKNKSTFAIKESLSKQLQRSVKSTIPKLVTNLSSLRTSIKQKDVAAAIRSIQNIQKNSDAIQASMTRELLKKGVPA